MRQREEELRSARVGEPGPLLAERYDLEPACVDDRLVLLGVDRADGVDERPTRLQALGGGAEQRELQLRQRGRTPPKVGSLPEYTEPRARRIHEGTVEAGELGRKLGAVGLDDGDVCRLKRREIGTQLACAVGVDLDRSDLAAELRGLASRCGAEVEHAVAVLRADCEADEL